MARARPAAAGTRPGACRSPARASGAARLPACRRSWRAIPGVPWASRSVEVDHGADRLALVHQVEGLVDALQRQGVGDEGIELDLAAHRLLHHARQLRAALDPAEGAAAPD